MTATVKFELACIGVGAVVAIIAAGVHSGDIGLASTALAVLAGYAAWLDWRR